MSTLMRRAVRGAYYTSTNIAVEAEQLQFLQISLERATALYDKLMDDPIVTRDIAMEAEALTGRTGFVAAYDRSINGKKLRGVALEGVVESIFLGVSNAVKSIIEMIAKFFKWLFGGSGSSASESSGGAKLANKEHVKEQEKAVEETVKMADKVVHASPEIKKAMHDVKEAKAEPQKEEPKPAPKPEPKEEPKEKSPADSTKDHEAAMKAVLAKSKNLLELTLNNVLHYDIIDRGEYTKAMMEFSTKIENVMGNAGIVKQAEAVVAWIEKNTERAKKIDEKAAPHLNKARSEITEGSEAHAMREEMNAFIRDIEGEVDALAEKSMSKDSKEWLKNTLDKLQKLHHDGRRPAHKDAFSYDPLEALKKVLAMAKEFDFEDASTVLMELEKQFKKVSDELGDMAKLFGKTSETLQGEGAMGTAQGRLYRKAANVVVELGGHVSMVMRAISQYEKYYDAVVETQKHLAHGVQVIATGVVEVSKKYNQEISPDMKNLVKEFNEAFAEMKKYSS